MKDCGITHSFILNPYNFGAHLKAFYRKREFRELNFEQQQPSSLTHYSVDSIVQNFFVIQPIADSSNMAKLKSFRCQFQERRRRTKIWQKRKHVFLLEFSFGLEDNSEYRPYTFVFLRELKIFTVSLRNLSDLLSIELPTYCTTIDCKLINLDIDAPEDHSPFRNVRLHLSNAIASNLSNHACLP